MKMGRIRFQDEYTKYLTKQKSKLNTDLSLKLSNAFTQYIIRDDVNFAEIVTLYQDFVTFIQYER